MSQSGEQPHASGVGGLFGFRRPPRQSAPGADGDVSGPGRATYDRESEKRLAKLLKKARPFFDEKLKPKARLQALYTFLGASVFRRRVSAHQGLCDAFQRIGF